MKTLTRNLALYASQSLEILWIFEELMVFLAAREILLSCKEREREVKHTLMRSFVFLA